MADKRIYRTKEWYGFTDAGLQWLKDKGCEWVKVTAEPGDLLLCMISMCSNGQLRPSNGKNRGLSHTSLQCIIQITAAPICGLYLLYASQRRN